MGNSISKTELKKLEESGEFVFHGSALKLDMLEPRQAYTLSKTKKKMVKDGEPAVAATPYADIAIFRAIINSENVPGKHWSNFGASVKDGNVLLEFGATKNTLERAMGKNGYVYVFYKKDFLPKSGHSESIDWRRGTKVKPVRTIEVASEDLPSEIKIVEDLVKSLHL